MTVERFEEIFEQAVKQDRAVLVVKAREYMRGTDRLHNFKRQGAMDGETPHKAAWGNMKKHIISISDIISDYEIEGCLPSYDTIKEKFGDARNYLYLIEALFIESMEEEVS